MNQPASILFVDDEPMLLEGLRRQFHSRRAEWSLRFATSGAQALEMLESQPATAIVADMVMPGMTGAELLHLVRSRWPASMRFILSGQTDQSQLLTHIGAIHQFIQKPCPPDHIERMLLRALALAQRVEAPELASVAASLRALPVVSRTYRTLLRELDQPACNADRIAPIVASDIGLTAKLLQLVNSAFFGMPRRVRTVKEALVLIGLSNVRHLAITAQIFESLAREHAIAGIIDRLWHVSADIGALAGELAKAEGMPAPVCDAARVSGTLSLVGRAVLVYAEPARYRAMLHRMVPLKDSIVAAERAEFGVTQEHIGAYALGLWGFEDEIIESVACQSAPGASELSTGEHALRFVHAARSRIECLPLVDRTGSSTDTIATPLGDAA